MTDLRMKRLLTLAGRPADHKRFYSQYCELMYAGYVGWVIGWAYLTPKGEEKLKELNNVCKIYAPRKVW